MQNSLDKYETLQDGSGLINSLEYYLTVSSDITKIIRGLIKSQKNAIIDKIGTIFRDVNKDLSLIAFEIFKRFVVFD